MMLRVVSHIIPRTKAGPRVSLLVVFALAAMAGGAPTEDLVESLPGFEALFSNDSALSFEVYSGYLSVNLTGSGLVYDALNIHYEFHTCAASSASCPVAVWHQGGPGGSSVFGAWTEMGPFQLMADGPVTNLDSAWNNVAHMLYLESPAGSTIAGAGTGWSSCSIGGVKQEACSWDDKTQAAAYARTLATFFEKFPEFADYDLYLVGESYAGQYIPNIANYILDHPDVLGKPLAGIAVGNGCWGGNETTVRCNGPRAEENDIDIYYGKGLLSKKLYDEIQTTCDWSIETVEDDDDESISVFGESCVALLDKARNAVGPYNVYNIYDNCNLHPTATLDELRATMHQDADAYIAGYKRMAARARTTPDTTYAAGFAWNCESDPALDNYFERADVQSALHLDDSGSQFEYQQSGPASITLYPKLLKNMRVLIYNGDADLCVPYTGNEEWTTSMADQGYATPKRSWHPWYLASSSNFAPAGYVTTYDVPGKVYNSSGGDDFAFLTIRLAGHMVPQYQPQAALNFFKRFLMGESF